MPRTKQLLLAAAILAAPALAPAQEALTENEAQFDSLLRETDGLRVYNDLLERQISSQRRDIDSLATAVEQVPDLERQIPPLLIRIVEGLERFVQLDLPFLEQERADRVAQLKTLIEDADASDADKFRRIMEAWEVENEYGRGLAFDTGRLAFGDTTREVEFLRLGRLTMVYQTTDDAADSGVWDSSSNQWVPLGSQHRNSIRQALRMARNQVAPNMVLLPVMPAEE